MNNIPTEEENARLRVLVVSDAIVSPDGDPGGEAWEIAEALSRDYDVILALPGATSYTHGDFAVIYYNQRNLGLVARDSEAVICGRDILEANSFFRAAGSVAPTSRARLRQGVIEGVAAPAAATGDSYYIWLPPEDQDQRGAGHYLARLRFHKQRGGYRYMLSRVLIAARRRLGMAD